ncbi:MAG: TonB-dependent receptor [Gammaproteobacteria bacterium]|nr:TonB-dependent receptor [Gammaproteobacteria bacterium]
MNIHSQKLLGTSFLYAVSMLAFVGAVSADDNPAASDAAGSVEDLVVQAHPLSDGDLAQSVEVMDAEAIARTSGISLGDVLSEIRGVRSASFGPKVGQPVINGLSGTRVLVTENGQETFDVSYSADHCNTVEPFLADRIEVLKGASTLLYGSGAMGGVVEVQTNRVPTTVPDKTITGRGLVRGNDASNGIYGGLHLDGGMGNFAWHLDGYASDHRDVSIPGYASLDPFAEDDHDDHDDHEDHDDEHEHEHEEDEHEHDDEHADEMPVKGRLANSYAEYKGGSVGGSFVFDRGHFGVSVATRDWQYGIPGAHHHHHEDEHEHMDGHDDDHEGEHEHEDEHDDHEEHDEHAAEEGSPWIDLQQTRVQSRLGIYDPLPGFRALEASLTVSEYDHGEIEGGREIGYFGNDAWEGRIVLDGEEMQGWQPSLGLQFGVIELGLGSSEASADTSESQHVAAFALAEKNFDMVEVEAGARIESTDIEDGEGVSRDYLATSFSLGAVFTPQESLRIRLLTDYAMRAPRGNELFSEFAHLATQGFEVGNVNLDEEEAFNLSAGIDYERGPLSFSANLYRYAFDNYIYQRETEDEVGGLDVIEWAQNEATFTGGDIGVEYSFSQASTGVSGAVSLGFDMVRTDLDDPREDHLPRTPANRALLAGEISWRSLWARLAYTHVFEQDETASYETPTASYDNVDLQVDYRIDFAGLNDLTLFLAGRNLTDEEQRNHVSFVKDEVPLPGRRVEAGVRFRF